MWQLLTHHAQGWKTHSSALTSSGSMGSETYDEQTWRRLFILKFLMILNPFIQLLLEMSPTMLWLLNAAARLLTSSERWGHYYSNHCCQAVGPFLLLSWFIDVRVIRLQVWMLLEILIPNKRQKCSRFSFCTEPTLHGIQYMDSHMIVEGGDYGWFHTSHQTSLQGVAPFQTFTLVRSSTDNGWWGLAHSLCSSSSRRCWIRFGSGFCSGQSISFTANWEEYFGVDPSSCWNRKKDKLWTVGTNWTEPWCLKHHSVLYWWFSLWGARTKPEIFTCSISLINCWSIKKVKLNCRPWSDLAST